MKNSRLKLRSYNAIQCATERGASLIIVMMILVIVSLLGVGGAQIALMGERGARNDRDQQVAWQAAEAALIDAEADMLNSNNATRKAQFDGKSTVGFAQGCGASSPLRGLCDLVQTGKPAWLTVDFGSTDADAKAVEFGEYTGHSFAMGNVGVQPAQAPRYLIELVPDPVGDKGEPPKFLYRVTAMGFGPRSDTQAVLQMIYRM